MTTKPGQLGTGINFDQVTFDNGFTVTLSRPDTRADRADWEAFARLLAETPAAVSALRAVLKQVSKYDASMPEIREARALLARIDGK